MIGSSGAHRAGAGMRTAFVSTVFFAGVFCTSSSVLAEAAAEAPRVTQGALSAGPFRPSVFDGDLRALPLAPAWRPGDPIKEIPKRNNHQGKIAPGTQPVNPVSSHRDPLLDLQTSADKEDNPSRDFGRPALNIAGQEFTGVLPPDTVGEIGPAYYIQLVNAGAGTQMTVYDKTNGGVAAGPLFVDSFGSGDCANGLGDPIVLFDQLAQRWLISEFSSFGNQLCVYVSRTSDPVAGGWYNYAFEAPGFPDYPKYGVWTDAYYVTSNESSPAAYALERERMLDGLPAGVQRFAAPSLGGFGFQALQAADQDGDLPPPAGAPGIFMRHRDDEVHEPSSNDPDRDFLEIWEFRVDWSDPGASSFSGPTDIPVAEFDSSLCGLFAFACFEQPAGPTLDPLREVIMYRLAYRNFGSHEALVGNFVTDINGADLGGIRWFELRRTGEGWNVFQEGTFASPGGNAWMGGIAMDGDGNIALGYSESSLLRHPGVRYVGRLASDTPGTMPQGDYPLIGGLGSVSGNRWGDYSSMSIDPIDDCTFWYTNEYGSASGLWATQIGAFRFDSCGSPSFTLSVSDSSHEVCAPEELAPVTLNVGQLQGFSNPVSLSFVDLPAGFSGSFSSNPVQPGGTATVSIDVGAGVAFGEYDFAIQGSAEEAGDRSVPMNVAVFDSAPQAPALTLPSDGATEQSLTPGFAWSAAAQGQSYVLEIADDADFASIVYTAQVSGTGHTTTQALASSTEYFWRVRASNLCGTGGDSPVFSFTTANLICSLPALAIPDGTPTGTTDSLSVAAPGTLQSLEVTIRATHTWVGDLIFRLEHVDSGTTVTLIDQPGVPATEFGCPGSDMDVRLSDDARLDVEDICGQSIPAIAGVYVPEEPLSAFVGLPLSGTWRLFASDSVSPDAGTLDSWCLAPQSDEAPDADGDGISDALDNCTGAANANQRDTDGDGLGNACDADLNGDCVVNFLDLGMLRIVFLTDDADADFNGDNTVDFDDLGMLKGSFYAPPGPGAAPNLCTGVAAQRGR